MTTGKKLKNHMDSEISGAINCPWKVDFPKQVCYNVCYKKEKKHETEIL